MLEKLPNLYNTQRIQLCEAVPLKQPFTVAIHASSVCNFKCEFCAIHSSVSTMIQDLKSAGHYQPFMSYETFQRAVDHIAGAGWRLKKLQFTGNGEPLMNKEIARMVAYAKEQNVAERIEIMTNGVLLTPELSDALIEAGVDLMRVAIEGLSAEQYLKTSKVEIDFEKFIQCLEYFYAHKKHTRVYLKTLDYLLKGEDDEKRFRNLFRNAADDIAVETVLPYGEIDPQSVSGKPLQAGTSSHTNICARPFTGLNIYADGGVSLCICPGDTMMSTVRWGNVNTESLLQIWNSEARRDFLLEHLKGTRKIEYCRGCYKIEYNAMESDLLDGHEEEIRQRILALK